MFITNLCSNIAGEFPGSLSLHQGWRVYILAEDIKVVTTEMLPESGSCLMPDIQLNNLLVLSGIVVHKKTIFFFSVRLCYLTGVM